MVQQSSDSAVSEPADATNWSRVVLLSLVAAISALALIVAIVGVFGLFLVRGSPEMVAGPRPGAEAPVATIRVAPDRADMAEPELIPLVDLCRDEDGHPARRGNRFYCLGPVAVEMSTALESSEVVDAASETGPGVRLVLREADAGIDPLNELADACFRSTDDCPSGQVAFERNGQVLSAPVIQAATFERESLVVAPTDNGQPSPPAEVFLRAIDSSELRPVLWSRPSG